MLRQKSSRGQVEARLANLPPCLIGMERAIACAFVAPARSGPLKVLAYSQDDKNQLDEGKLDLIDNQIVQTTGTIRLRASFPNARRMLWPGELTNARLFLETRHDGLTIAASAIQQGP